eukprot:931530_1
MRIEEFMATISIFTRGVGEKLLQSPSVDQSAKIEVRREPSNPADCNAILVHCLKSDVPVMYLTARLSAMLAPLFDEQTITVEAYWLPYPTENDVIADGNITGDWLLRRPKYVRLVVLQTGPPSSRDKMKQLDDLRNFSQSEGSRESYDTCAHENRYLLRFTTILKEVLRRYSHILDDDEHRFVKSFLDCDEDSQRLFSRLYFRKKCWLDASTLEYDEVRNSKKCLKILAGHGFMKSSDDRDTVLMCLLPDISRDALKKFAVKSGLNLDKRVLNKKKADLIGAITKRLTSQRTLTGILLKDNKRVGKTFHSICGQWVRVAERALDVFHSCFCLFYLDSDNDGSSEILNSLGRVKFADYEIPPDQSMFPSREVFLAYFNARQLYDDMQSALDGEDNEKVETLLQVARIELASISGDQASCQTSQKPPNVIDLTESENPTTTFIPEAQTSTTINTTPNISRSLLPRQALPASITQDITINNSSVESVPGNPKHNPCSTASDQSTKMKISRLKLRKRKSRPISSDHYNVPIVKRSKKECDSAGGKETSPEIHTCDCDSIQSSAEPSTSSTKPTSSPRTFTEPVLPKMCEPVTRSHHSQKSTDKSYNSQLAKLYSSQSNKSCGRQLSKSCSRPSDKSCSSQSAKSCSSDPENGFIYRY